MSDETDTSPEKEPEVQEAKNTALQSEESASDAHSENEKIFVFSPALGMFFFLISLAMLAVLAQHFHSFLKTSHNGQNLGVLIGGLGGLAYFWFLYSIAVPLSLFSVRLKPPPSS